ncbi:hypothetical protein ONZ45_g16279 [Pleurotus djamor]|nr:hypothetical protein ONZ45_g16279 [Pleurotus djamor]
MSASVSTLDKGWYWKQRNTAIEVVTAELPSAASSPAVTGGSNITTSWNPTASFPSEVHVELLKCGKIPHPYVAFNEHKVQWIGEVEWLYYCTFGRVQKLANQRSELVLEGLDTICDVYLNGTKVLSTSNMFHAHAIPLDDSVTSSKLNTIFLHFKSAKKAAKDEEERYGAVRAGSTNLGDPSRVYIRKAQYDWRPVRIETYKARISELQPCVNVHFTNASGSKYAVNLSVNVVMEGAFDGKCSLSVSLKDLKGNVVMQTANTPLHASRDSNTVSIKPFVQWSLSETLVQLWWPVGYGNQTLYNLEAHLSSGVGEVLHRVTKRIGFRTVELVQDPLREPDQYGTGSTFLFEINKVRMFMGGSNWIPADNFLTTITEERYRAWLKLLVKGNQNMVRVWGGGIYEPDVFYDICDELGVLVWQDFQFACGVYPAHDDFVESVRKEATEAVLRLRHHPSLVLLCGNNEDYQQVLQWGGIDALPARKIYEEILPDVVANLTDPPIPYHRGSPYGGKGWDTSDPTIGDVHQWNIWGGKELPYQEYENMGGRFVSEFGVPSMPSMGTIKSWMVGADESDWYPQSIWMAQHTKAGSFERRFAILMNENFRLTGDLEIYRYTTQLLQSEAMKYAYSVWRRKWCGRGKEYTAGVLVWQLNDCWPVTSWAIVDYYLRPKLAYYSIARELAPVSVGISRTGDGQKQPGSSLPCPSLA